LGKKRSDVSAKRAALRKTKVLQSDMSVPFLNNSQPHSTKHQPNVVSASLNFSNYTNSAVSLLNKIMANQEKSKKSLPMRSPSNLRQPETTKSVVQHGNYFSMRQDDKEQDQDKDKKKSTSASRKTNIDSINLKKSGLKLPIKDLHTFHNKGISMITTKHNTETDRELLTHGSQDPPLISLHSAKKHNNSPTTRDVLLSFSNKKQPSEETGRVSLGKLEKAFEMFLEEHRPSLGQGKVDKISKAWSLFTETVKTIEGGNNNGRQETSGRRTYKEEFAMKKSGQSVSTALPTEKTGVAKVDLVGMMDKQQQAIDLMKKKEDSMLKMIMEIKSKAAEIEKDIEIEKEAKYEEKIVSLQGEDDSILSQSMDLLMSSSKIYFRKEKC